MKTLFFILAVITVISGLIFTGCASNPAPTTSSPTKPVSSPSPAPAVPTATATAPSSAAAPIKIGVLMSLTGPDAILSPGLKAALEYRVDQYGGQIAGRKIQVIIEDDATDPVTGTDKLRKLLQSDNVDVVMGATNGAVAGSVTNFMKQLSTPLLLFMPKSKTILDLGSSRIYLPFGTNAGAGYYSGLYAAQKLGYKTAAVAEQDMIGGVEFVDGSIAGFQKGGGSIVQNQTIPVTTADVSPYLTAMKQADCVIFWFNPVLSQRFVSQYYQAGLKMPLVIAYTSVLSPQLLSAIGDKSAGIVGTDMYTSLIDTPANKTFVDAFTKKYGAAALSSNTVGTDICVTLYLEAVKSTGGDTSSDKINNALHKIKVDTEAGTFSFNATGLGIADLYLLKSAKLDSGFGWSVLDKYPQVELGVPK